MSKALDLSIDIYEVVEIKRNKPLALVKADGKLRYVHRDTLPVHRRVEYYKARKLESLNGQA